MAQDRPPPPPASIRFCDARRQADRPRIGPRSMLCGPARTTDASVSSPRAATMPTTRASSQSMLLSFHDLRIMVTHGFRNQQNAPAKNYNCNARRYLADSLLGSRLRQDVRLMTSHSGKSALDILGL